MAIYFGEASDSGLSRGTINPTLVVRSVPVAAGTGQSDATVKPNVKWASGIVSGSSQGFASVRESPIDWINRPKPAVPTGQVTFNWSPVTTPFSYVVGTQTIIPALLSDGVTLSTDSQYYNTPTDNLITFTAAINLPHSAAEYQWDFGDGNIGWGEVATHTYKVANPYGHVTLKVTDALGNEYFASKRIYLYQPISLTLYPEGSVYPDSLLFPSEPGNN